LGDPGKNINKGQKNFFLACKQTENQEVFGMMNALVRAKTLGSSSWVLVDVDEKYHDFTPEEEKKNEDKNVIHLVKVPENME
jgi:hypothetical protein